MSKQRVIKDEIWSDEWFFDLDPVEKLVWVFLLTNERGNIAGVYKLSLKWGAMLTGLDANTFEKIIVRFHKEGKIVYDGGWVGIVNFYKHLSYKNPSVDAGIKRIGEEIKTDCPQPVYSVYLTLLNLTLLNLSVSEQSSQKKTKKCGSPTKREK